MRDYSKVSPQFWNGKTGKALKKQGPEAVIVGLYLLTCQHANMLGLYYLSKTYIAVDTGLGLEGACKGLVGACEAGFCLYDDDSEVVWVKEMATYQVGESLGPKDNQCLGVQRQYDALPENPFLSGFYEKYAAAYHMKNARGEASKTVSPLEAPPKPLRSQEQEQEQESEQENEQEGESGANAPTPAKPDTSKGSRLPLDWTLPADCQAWAEKEFPHVNAANEALKFRDYWHGKAGADGRKASWPATWRNWIRRAGESRQPGPAKQRHNDFENRDYTAGVGSDGRF